MHQHHFFIFPSSIHMMRRKNELHTWEKGGNHQKLKPIMTAVQCSIFFIPLEKKLVEKKKRSRFFPPIFSPINHHIILNATLFWQQLKDRINQKTVCKNTLILWNIELIYYLGRARLSYKMQLLQKITYHTRAIISRGLYIFQA